MPVEAATFVSDLVVTNPGHTDGLNSADAHMRLIKTTLKNTFVNFTSGVLTSTQAMIDAAVASITGTGLMKFAVGAVGAPTIAPLGNPLTGIYSAGTDKLDIAINATNVAEFNSAGIAVTGALGTTGSVVSGGPYTGGTGQLVPTGTVFTWLTGTAPIGYLFANGQAVSRTTYAALFALWGTTFGVGNGTTTFNMPDLRDVVEIGQTTMGGVGARGLLTNQTITTIGAVVGECTHILSNAEIPLHTHAVTDPGHLHQITNLATGNVFSAGGVPAYKGGSGNTNTDVATTGISIQSAGGATPPGGGAHNNVQQSFVVTKIIKT